MTTPTLTVQQLAAMPRVNLLPREIHERRKARQVQVGLTAAVAGAVVLVGALYLSAHHSVSNAQSELTSAQAKQTALNSEIAKYNNDVALRGQLAARQGMLQQAMGPEIQWSHYLSDLTLRIPDNVWLTTVTFQETAPSTTTPAATTTAQALTGGEYGTVTFAGIAFSHDDVATWLDSLSKEKGYVNPYFSNSTEAFIGPRKTVNFSSTVQLSAKALSGRYAKPAGS